MKCKIYIIYASMSKQTFGVKVSCNGVGGMGWGAGVRGRHGECVEMVASEWQLQ